MSDKQLTPLDFVQALGAIADPDPGFTRIQGKDDGALYAKPAGDSERRLSAADIADANGLVTPHASQLTITGAGASVSDDGSGGAVINIPGPGDGIGLSPAIGVAMQLRTNQLAYNFTAGQGVGHLRLPTDGGSDGVLFVDDLPAAGTGNPPNYTALQIVEAGWYHVYGHASIKDVTPADWADGLGGNNVKPADIESNIYPQELRVNRDLRYSDGNPGLGGYAPAGAPEGPFTEILANPRIEGNNEPNAAVAGMMYLYAGERLSLSIVHPTDGDSSGITVVRATFSVAKVNGTRGAQGEPGPAGSNGSGEIGQVGLCMAPIPWTNWHLMNGQALSRTTWAGLWTYAQVSGLVDDLNPAAYGNGDGSTTFTVPNVAGFFPKAADGDLGDTGGVATHNLQHNHTTGASGSTAVGLLGVLAQGAPANHTHTVSNALATIDNRPPWFAINFAVYGGEPA